MWTQIFHKDSTSFTDWADVYHILFSAFIKLWIKWIIDFVFLPFACLEQWVCLEIKYSTSLACFTNYKYYVSDRFDSTKLIIFNTEIPMVIHQMTHSPVALSSLFSFTFSNFLLLKVYVQDIHSVQAPQGRNAIQIKAKERKWKFSSSSFCYFILYFLGKWFDNQGCGVSSEWDRWKDEFYICLKNLSIPLYHT